MHLKRLSAVLALGFILQNTTAQRISYIVSFPNLAHHEAQVELIASDIPTRNATFRMSRSSPGRYATHEFGKNVYDVKAFDQSGKPVTINRVDGDVYEARAERLRLPGEAPPGHDRWLGECLYRALHSRHRRPVRKRLHFG